MRRTLRLAARPRRRGVTVRVGPAWLAHHVIRVTVSGSRRTMTLPGADPHPGPTRRLVFPPAGGPSVSARMTRMRRRAITRAHGLGARTQSPDSDVGNRGERIRPAAEAKGPARVRSAAPAVRIRARENSAAPRAQTAPRSAPRRRSGPVRSVVTRPRPAIRRCAGQALCIPACRPAHPLAPQTPDSPPARGTHARLAALAPARRAWRRGFRVRTTPWCAQLLAGSESGRSRALRCWIPRR